MLLECHNVQKKKIKQYIIFLYNIFSLIKVMSVSQNLYIYIIHDFCILKKIWSVITHCSTHQIKTKTYFLKMVKSANHELIIGKQM